MKHLLVMIAALTLALTAVGAAVAAPVQGTPRINYQSTASPKLFGSLTAPRIFGQVVAPRIWGSVASPRVSWPRISYPPVRYARLR